jgi:predicted AlkP superfamily pyrophosphatase or phosphodiesterase
MPSFRISSELRVKSRPLCAIVLLVFILSACAGSSLSGGSQASHAKPILVLVSLDGFRWDYLDRGASPNINSIAVAGVRAKGLIPVYPSETFPNHYSIVTGVYPEKHGIVKNSMWDPEFDAAFSMSRQAAESRWWGAEPIWVTAEKQGQTAAVFFWPGSEAEVEGTRPAYWKKYDGKVPNSERVEQVLSWLDLPEDKRPSFVAIYFSDTDSAGHEFGPDSPEVLAAIKNVDKSVGALEAGLEERKLTDRTSIIIVSDHGMAATHRTQTVYLADYVDISALQKGHEFTGTNALIWPIPGKEDEVYQALQKAPHIKAYRKQNTPDYFHYRNNRRIAPVVCVADEGWSMEVTRWEDGRAERAAKINPTDRTTGAHGYDPRLPSMQGIFVAAGPAFRERLVVPPFENVQIYNLMCMVLGLKPAANDGDLAWTEKILRPAQRASNSPN